jgi:proteasome lid subunit RPN8/RPN11
VNRLRLTQKQWSQMTAHVSALAPEEACGLLGGEGGRVRAVYPVENALHSPLAYTMEPQAQVETMMEIEEEGWDLVAIFHSHPGGPPVPSDTDVRQAYYPESLTIILSPGEAGAWQARAFQIDGGRVVEAEIVVEPDGGIIA